MNGYVLKKLQKEMKMLKFIKRLFAVKVRKVRRNYLIVCVSDDVSLKKTLRECNELYSNQRKQWTSMRKYGKDWIVE